MPAAEMRVAALAALAFGNDSFLGVNEIDHLDAGALQILLALQTAREAHGRSLHLVNVSSLLLPWFEYAGAADCFALGDRKSGELKISHE
jgi:ABC-type transporter Mla MlaB component